MRIRAALVLSVSCVAGCVSPPIEDNWSPPPAVPFRSDAGSSQGDAGRPPDLLPSDEADLAPGEDLGDTHRPDLADTHSPDLGGIHQPDLADTHSPDLIVIPPPPDMGVAPDLAPPPPDMTGAGTNDDMAVAPADMTALPDLTSTNNSDLTQPPADMGTAADLATAPADLAQPPQPDLETMQQPDLAQTQPPDLLTSPPDLVTPPPPPELTFYSGSANLGVEVIDASPDETGNIWAVTRSSLHIKRPQEQQFRRYTNADGLHIDTIITAVAGGKNNEGWVGLLGYEDGSPITDPPYQREKGKAEHVWLLQDGTLKTLHYAQLHNDNSSNYWETRSARRLLFAHDGPNAGHLFMGGNHGVTHILNDQWGDHIHVEVKEPNGTQLFGEWYGLAIDPITNGLWTCGRYSCGLQSYQADPRQWVMGKFKYAFTVFRQDHALSPVPSTYRDDFLAVAVDDEGVVYMLSETKGMAAWDRRTNTYATIAPRPVPGMGKPVDMVADPDGTIWVADETQVLRWNPKAGTTKALPLPSNDIRRLYMDRTSSPRALYISTGWGLAIYRGP